MDWQISVIGCFRLQFFGPVSPLGYQCYKALMLDESLRVPVFRHYLVLSQGFLTSLGKGIPPSKVITVERLLMSRLLSLCFRGHVELSRAV